MKLIVLTTPKLENLFNFTKSSKFSKFVYTITLVNEWVMPMLFMFLNEPKSFAQYSKISIG